jgi:hypothetical protein
MAKRFLTHGAQYFQFITTPDIEPTNNLAEQAIRFVVIEGFLYHALRAHWENMPGPSLLPDSG